MITQISRLLRWLAAIALAAGIVGPVAAAPARRVVLISWDGAANWVVDRLLAEGRLPNVARLARMGVRADYCTPAYPSKTAPGHTAMMTGAYGDVNGITANAVPLLPRSAHTLLESQSGFDSAALRAEPVWLPAAKAGKRVASLSFPHASPPDLRRTASDGAGIPSDRFVSAGSFGELIEPDRIWDGAELQPAKGWDSLPKYVGAPRELSLRVGDTPFHLLVYDDPGDPTAGADTLLIRQGSKSQARATVSVTLKPAKASESTAHFSRRFRVTKGTVFGFTYFRLFSLAPDGRMVLYQRGVNGRRRGEPAERIRHLQAAGGYFAVPFDLYEKGALGPTLWERGDGAAERRLIECLRFDNECLEQGVRYALRTWHPDLLFHYIPWIDSAGHTWMGALDPDSPRYKVALARKLWPFYAAAYELQDHALGDLLDHVDRQTVVVLVSDHGMVGTSRMVSMNVILEKAGLLTRTTDNQIDLSRTKICAPPWSSYFLTVNGTDRKGGIVPPAQREAVLRATTESLLAATDPLSGRHLITQVFRSDQVAGLGIGGPTGGDLYFELPPGCEPVSNLTAENAWDWPSPIGGGAHGFLSLRPKLQAIFFMAGPGVVRGRRLAGMRQIDIAPTLCRLLGIPAPQNARGHVVGEALVSPR